MDFGHGLYRISVLSGRHAIKDEAGMSPTRQLPFMCGSSIFYDATTFYPVFWHGALFAVIFSGGARGVWRVIDENTLTGPEGRRRGISMVLHYPPRYLTPDNDGNLYYSVSGRGGIHILRICLADMSCHPIRWYAGIENVVSDGLDTKYAPLVYSDGKHYIVTVASAMYSDIKIDQLDCGVYHLHISLDVAEIADHHYNAVRLGVWKFRGATSCTAYIHANIVYLDMQGCTIEYSLHSHASKISALMGWRTRAFPASHISMISEHRSDRRMVTTYRNHVDGSEYTVDNGIDCIKNILWMFIPVP